MDITRQIQVIVAWADLILCHPIFRVTRLALCIFIGYLIGRWLINTKEVL